MQKKIKRFKFVHNHVDIVYFEDIIRQAFHDHPYPHDVIVFPPIRLIDRVLRGPNHAQILAKIVQKISKSPILCPFRKSFLAGHQAKRIKKERAQIRAEYSILEKYIPQIQGKKVLLIDDLITTGYTAHTLANLLKIAGVSEVIGYFLASEKTV